MVKATTVIFIVISVVFLKICNTQTTSKPLENTSIIKDSEEYSTTTLKNDIKLNQPLNNISYERILKPMTQIIAENYHYNETNKQINATTFSNGGKQRSDDDFKPSPRDFRPSPQLDSNFEHNKVPVIPVLGEPRNIFTKTDPTRVDSGWKFPENFGGPIQNPSLQGASSSSVGKKTSYGSSPAESYNLGKSVKHPYHFDSEDKGEKRVYEVRTEDFYKKPLNEKEEVYEIRELSNKHRNYENSYPFEYKLPQYTKEEAFEGKNYEGFERDRQHGISKTYYEHNDGHIPQKYNPHYKYLFLKKAIKFLATVIPIGLLISAFSPAIISISPANNTTGQTQTPMSPMGAMMPPPMNNRIRTKKLLDDTATSENQFDLDKIIPKFCEERILCEIISGAQMSQYGLQKVETLFHSFTKQEEEFVDKMNELHIIFEAAKNGSCDEISCKLISNKEVSSREYITT